MNKKKTGLLMLILMISACSPHIHLDFLGEKSIREVVLVDARAEEKILLVDVSGVIAQHGGPSLLAKEGGVLSRVYHRLEKAAEDPKIKGVIIRLDTPGGEVTASDILYHEILRFREKTGLPVLALMMGVCASGGYYIASACDYLIAHPSSLTGSIGVISVFPDIHDLFDKVGVRVQVIKSGKMKDSGSPFREMTDAEKEVFQEIVDEYYRRFLDAVAESRKEVLSKDQLVSLADGRIFTATQALDSGLVDAVGYFSDALKTILDLASIPRAKVIAYTYYPRTRTNLYAARMEEDSFRTETSISDILRTLGGGFYYLWHPQLNR